MKNKNIIRNIRFGIRSKLLLSFAVLTFILLISVCATLFITANTLSFGQRLVEVNMPSKNEVGKLSNQVNASSATLRAYILTKDNKFETQWLNAWKQIDQSSLRLNILSKQWSSKQAIDQWELSKQIIGKFKNTQQQVANAAVSAEGASLAEKILTEQAMPDAEKLLTILDGSVNSKGMRAGGLYDMFDNDVQRNAGKLIDEITNLQLFQWALLILGIAGSICIAVYLARSLLRPIYSSIEIARSIAEGNRSIKIEIKSLDETSDLLSSLDDLQCALAKSDKEINDKTMALQNSEAEIQTLLSTLQTRVKHYREFIEKVSEGDLTKRLPVDGEDDLAKLGQHLNDMTENLEKIALQITESSHNMINGLVDVDTAVNSQASGANEQNSAVNETTSIIEEIKATSNQTLEKAQNLGESAERTRAEGERGLSFVEKTVESMRDIQTKVNAIAESILALSEQTQQIGETTSSVSNLAQQSKLLALNASIEAAKAGEAGKGFAVVAAEVKTLAEQSHQATVQVQKILQDIQEATDKAVMTTEEGNKGVEVGLGLVMETGDVMKHLNEVIDETTMATQQIVAAVKQEAVGIDQIAEAMTEINKATGQFVTSTEQTKSVSESLTGIANNLKERVSYYKVNGSSMRE